MTTTNDARRRGRYERVSDPAGTRYLLHAVPSGYLGFSVAVAAFERMADSIRRSGLR